MKTGLLVLLFVAAAGASLSSPEAPILLRNVRVFDDSTGTFGEPEDLLIEGDRIGRIGTLGGAAAGAREIDCRGKFALPGLFDCHTHLSHLTLKSADSLALVLEEFVARGVTQARDVGGPIDVLSDLSRRIAARGTVGPELFYTGPMLEQSPLTWAAVNEDQPGFTVAIDSCEDVDRLLPELARKGAGMIKTFNNFDPVVYRHLVEVANRLSLRIVHDPGTPLFHAIPMDTALSLGVTSIEHAKAPWPIVLTDELRAEHDALLSGQSNEMGRMALMMKVAQAGPDGVSLERVHALGDEMVRRGAFLCPTLHVFASMEEEAFSQIKEQNQLEEIPEEMKEMVRKGIAAMREVSYLFVRELAQRGVRFLVGQDGFEPAATLDEMVRLEECGVSRVEIIRGATIYPARWLGVDDRLGSVRPGGQADLLVVSDDPLAAVGNLGKTFLVVQRGRVVFSKDP
jgi:cytosine/adenosine deaminase-related metal-dependent hydrolase